MPPRYAREIHPWMDYIAVRHEIHGIVVFFLLLKWAIAISIVKV